MGDRLAPIKTSLFRKFLEKQGCKYYRTKSSHEIWGKKDLTRPITFQATNKEVPPFHIQTNLRTLGISIEKFKEIIKKL